MAKAAKLALAAMTKIVPGNSAKLSGRLSLISVQSAVGKPFFCTSMMSNFNAVQVSRAQSTLSTLKTRHTLCGTKGCTCVSCSMSRKSSVAYFSSEVDKEVSAFLDKEIQFETSRASNELPKVSGFEVTTDGGDVTLTKSTGSEKIVVKLSVNGAVDSIAAEPPAGKEDEPPQMVCRPHFEVEISKGDGVVLALQCGFPQHEEPFEDGAEQLQQGDDDKLDDQFEIQEVALHNGDWKDHTFSVSAPTMDAELYDLLMDTLDERGINDEFIAQLVEYCTAYEGQQYIGFLRGLKKFVEK